MDNQTKIKILITDDDKFLLDMYSLKFGETGFEVTTASDGEDALAKVEGGLVPEIFLVDLVMPKMDGFQLIGKLKEKGLDKRSAIIILSNLGQEEEINKGLELGVDGYIVKAAATPSEVVTRATDILHTKKRVTN
jgi:DNA-binding response OmpR family regulator